MTLQDKLSQSLRNRNPLGLTISEFLSCYFTNGTVKPLLTALTSLSKVCSISIFRTAPTQLLGGANTIGAMLMGGAVLLTLGDL